MAAGLYEIQDEGNADCNVTGEATPMTYPLMTLRCGSSRVGVAGSRGIVGRHVSGALR